MLLKVGDTVQVVAGRDRGLTGKVLKLDLEESRVLVEGVSKIYKHVRKSQRNPQGGRLSKESFLDISNVMFVCPKTGKPTRLGIRMLDNGSKERFCRKSGATVDVVSAPKKKK